VRFANSLYGLDLMQASMLPLDGRGIVITRPAHQAGELAKLIAQSGGRPILFPAIEIRDVEDRTALNEIIDRLETYDLAIFISPNAVQKAYEAIRARRSFPPQLKVATIGRGSAETLTALGLGPVIAPADGADSESLLRLPELTDVAGRRVVIFRGSEGREVLRDTLIERGAIVDYAECYRRVRPETGTETLLHAWRAGEIAAIVVTSSEGLRNLHDLLGATGRQHLAMTPLFVPHPRIAATANKLGLRNVVITPSGDRAIAASLAEHFAER
jgi:uroporphyrinogen-III synthase